MTQEVIQVPRDDAGHYTITVLQPDPTTPAGQPPTKYVGIPGMPALSVWIVWATGEFTHMPDVKGNMIPAGTRGFDGTQRNGLAFLASKDYGDPNTGYVMKFTIQPQSITVKENDIPDLTGSSDLSHLPSASGKWPLLLPHLPKYDLSLGAPYKWDVSQSVRVHISNPNLFPKLYMSDFETYDLYNNQAKADDLVEDFPTSDVEGNDDVMQSTQQNNPYDSYSNVITPYLNHDKGVIIGADAPALITPGNPSVYSDPTGKWEGWVYEEEDDFATFVRLQIYNNWYRVSNHLNWHSTLHVVCHKGEWQDGNYYSNTGPSPTSIVIR